MTEIVFFDFGNTIIHTDPRKVLPPFLAKHQLSLDWSLLPEAAPKAFAFYETAQTIAMTWDEVLAHWRQFHYMLLSGMKVSGDAVALAESLASSWSDPDVWPLFEGAREVILRVRQQGLRTGLISNWDAGLTRVLKALDVYDLFDIIVVSANVGHAKPEAAIFENALALAGVRPEAAVHVGDSLEADVAGAEAVGMRPIWISLGRPIPDKVESVPEIKNLFEVL